MGARWTTFLEAIGRLRAAEAGYSDTVTNQRQATVAEARQAARVLHDAYTSHHS